MEFIIQFIVALFATLSFAVIFSAPKKELFYCGFTGALGWIIYYIIVQFDMGVVFPSLIATLCLTIMARIFAAARSMPVTVYLLSGIFPLVPGAGIFYTAYYLFTNDRALSTSKGIETFEVTGAIVLGIIFGFGIPQSLFNLLKPKKNELLELCQICNFLRQILEILPTLHFLHQLPLEVFLFLCEFV